ncbi:hypothetical protein HM1_0857 [Heliomicrobium modesticaldum Ice1]|uniref:Uncharacterized protein n=1 Tax=Heliobacterium modesticaldum (strain ATCC 51547 / Ice1) TaxID=498761 RepID=B0TAQ2_HELMI|nr:hypothetical protein [Heliomicrobium modesticaldum]ABZ83704.1 hypothetical protein HM1_0857 [Heliomicrobium modesticaldum Ice1]
MDSAYTLSPAYRPMMCDRLCGMIGQEVTAEVRHPEGVRTYRGRLVSVGDDYIELEMEDSRPTAQRNDAVTEVMAGGEAYPSEETMTAEAVMAPEEMTAVETMAGDTVQAEQFFYPPYRYPYRFPYRRPFYGPGFGPGPFYRTFIPLFLLTSLLARTGYYY